MEDKKRGRIQARMDVDGKDVAYFLMYPNRSERLILKCTDLDLLETILYIGNEKTSIAALRSLSGIRTERANNLIIYTLEDNENARMRWQAASTLPYFVEAGFNQGVESLIDALNDTGTWLGGVHRVRNAAAEALGDIGDRKALEPLAAILEVSPTLLSKGEAYDQIKFQIAAAASIGKMSDPRGVRYLLGLVNRKGVREFVPTVLRNLVREKAGDPKEENLSWLIEPFIDGLKDDDKRIRKFAAMALGLIGDPSAESSLTEALNDTDRGVRRAAKKALK